MEEPGETNRGTGEESSIEIVPQPQEEGETPVHAVHLLDRDSDLLLFLFESLSKAGFDVTASSSVIDALGHLSRSHPEILIADADMPELSGAELLQRVKALSPMTHVILTSSRRDEPVFEEGLRRCGAQVVRKPLQESVLLRAIEQAVGP